MPRFSPLLLAVVTAVAAAQPAAPGASTWPMDEIVLTNGARFRGLILSETPAEVRMRTVRRPPGKPTTTLTTTFTRQDILAVNKLTDADRAVLKERLAELDPDGAGERKRMEAVELVPAGWLGKPDGARRYDSDYFSLVSSAREEVTRRAAARLEQVYTAFARFLPPTNADARPTVILLAPDPGEYRALLGPLGEANLLNPAVYDPATNQILCGSDLRRLGDELQTARVHHGQQLAGLVQYEQQVRRLYQKAELDRHLAIVTRERQRVTQTDKANLEKFDQATARLFALLYHESFHAYAAAFVYPPLPPEQVKAGKGTGELPRWLNEGLAQVFETAVVEAGELRADHADRARLEKAKDSLKGRNGAAGLVPLADLLVAGKDAFLAHHPDRRAVADRAYLTSWALAHYLTFGRRVIGIDAFKRYLVAVNSGADPRQAFAGLVGQELPAFEADWHAYLLRLQPNGTLGK
jgi:hypothetical protein